MTKFSGLKWWAGRLLESLGVQDSVHRPKPSELAFAAFALKESTVAVECGPRTDTHLAELAIQESALIYIFEASPIFSRKIKLKIRKIAEQGESPCL